MDGLQVVESHHGPPAAEQWWAIKNAASASRKSLVFVVCFDLRCAHSLGPVVPILRMFDVFAAKRFYVEYLGCSVDWQDGDGDRPVYMQVSRDALVLHLSTHHDDGTPGGAVLVETTGLEALHAELREKGYPFLNPGVGPGPGGGREMLLIDPSSNRLRFFERAAAT